jgi:hypothetical protein
LLPLILGTLTPMTQQDKISILGPRDDGSYVVEFRTAAGERLAISGPRLIPLVCNGGLRWTGI